MHARIDRGRAQLLTRTGFDWTHKYPSIARAVSTLPARQSYPDGELCGVRPDGKTSFDPKGSSRASQKNRQSRMAVR
jgi:ATP-dependent DNA ligase